MIRSLHLTAAFCLAVLSLVAIAGLGGCGSQGGTAEAEEATEATRAMVRYRRYLTDNADLMVAANQALLAELRGDELRRAQSRYARSRVRYSQIELAAEMVPKLNFEMNATYYQIADGDFVGYHRIESDLWSKESTEGTASIGQKLVNDSKEMRARIGELEPTALQLAEGAKQLLREDATFKLTGEEERYADCDLVDAAGSIEGVEAAFKAIEPVLGDEQLQNRINSTIGELYEELGDYGTLARDADQPRARSPGVSFVVFPSVDQRDRDEMIEQIEVLVRDFDQISAELRE